MAFSIAKAANWLHQVHRAHAVVGWWPDQFAIEDERTAYKVQDALLKKLVPKQGPLVGYKIALTSPQIWEQTGLRGPAYGPIRKKRVFEHKASVRADQWARLGVELEVILTVNADVPRPKDKPYDKDSIEPYIGEARAGFELIEDRGADQWARLGVELEVILTVNADVPRPKDKPYDKDSIEPYIGEARAGFELIDDRGADYSRLTIPWLVMDVGWNGGSLLAKPNKNWKNLDIGNLTGSISFDGKVMREGNSGDVLGHCYNSLAWLANKLGEHGKTLKKGMIVSTGSMVACQFVPPGSTAVGKIEGLGEVTLKYELPR